MYVHGRLALSSVLLRIQFLDVWLTPLWLSCQAPVFLTWPNNSGQPSNLALCQVGEGLSISVGWQRWPVGQPRLMLLLVWAGLPLLLTCPGKTHV